MTTRRMTMAQALICFLKNQYVERDGQEHLFFAGVLGIFGHGNVGGIGQALQQNPNFPYILMRNEQSGVHMAAGFAKANNRLRAFACTSSIGPGATNMITGAALATINRLPVLLLPGDIFARRNVAPVLQQLESPSSQDTGVNDCFKPVSRYWDRIYRPEQLITALPEVMRVLTSPSDCGAVTLALPQDVQAEAFNYPEELFRKRVWLIRRGQPDEISLDRAVEAIRSCRKPLIVAGGGVLMSEACVTLDKFVTQTGIPVAETQAGKGSLAWDHPQSVGAIGATGTLAANRLAHAADLVIGIGTRYADFTSASMTAFQNPDVRFVNINTAEFDAYKVGAIPVVADARVTLEQLTAALRDKSADVALIPVADYVRNPDLAMIEGLGVAARVESEWAELRHQVTRHRIRRRVFLCEAVCSHYQGCGLRGYLRDQTDSGEPVQVRGGAIPLAPHQSQYANSCFCGDRGRHWLHQLSIGDRRTGGQQLPDSKVAHRRDQRGAVGTQCGRG